MTNDSFENAGTSLISPARHAFAIVPADDADLPLCTRAVYVGQGGDIALRAVGSTEHVLFRNVPAGAVLAVRVASVHMTGTSADHLVGLA